jgi:shikimate dehydrogenase
MMRRAAVLGSPIAHSRSPVLHAAAYAALGLDWDYQAIEVTSGGLAEFRASLDETWIGLSLTMPLKTEALGIVDELTPEAERIGAVNTITIQGGTWFGSNTDVPAMTALLDGVTGNATILGAGATARSAVVALADLGVSDIVIWARRTEPALTLASYAESLGIGARGQSGPVDAALLQAPIVVNTLPGDAASHWASAIPDPTDGVLLDAAYDPWPPPMTLRWPAHLVRSGFDLLLNQAARQVESWTGLPAPRSAMAAALLSTIPKQTLDRALH